MSLSVSLSPCLSASLLLSPPLWSLWSLWLSTSLSSLHSYANAFHKVFIWRREAAKKIEKAIEEAESRQERPGGQDCATEEENAGGGGGTPTVTEDTETETQRAEQTWAYLDARIVRWKDVEKALYDDDGANDTASVLARARRLIALGFGDGGRNPMSAVTKDDRLQLRNQHILHDFLRGYGEQRGEAVLLAKRAATIVRTSTSVGSPSRTRTSVLPGSDDVYLCYLMAVRLLPIHTHTTRGVYRFAVHLVRASCYCVCHSQTTLTPSPPPPIPTLIDRSTRCCCPCSSSQGNSASQTSPGKCSPRVYGAYSITRI